jgi:hypothetical protein
MKIQMSPRSEHGAKTTIYPGHLSQFHHLMMVPLAGCPIEQCPLPVWTRPSAMGAFTRWERELWHLSKGLPEGSWRGRRMEKKKPHYSKLETIWETPRNPGTNSRERLDDPQRPK